MPIEVHNPKFPPDMRRIRIRHDLQPVVRDFAVPYCTITPFSGSSVRSGIDVPGGKASSLG